ncbi:hypothetical protein [Sedimenticola selenatireducens]|uniref:ATP-binding protein n=1 Tax=Sedimenticola selenatireducens TaxID=191960 RepID=A0A557SEU5_9GAMM|nr:hypothetical protein [Sedimenticola selenatireducens]TVO75891.1 hypothetical protein FHP88_07785 [Sedimenticola selenatireducens]TVT63750.1 MAG: hypothetical protein FHK78_10485 [Sedimenticola selenatireducens]
MNIIIEQLSDAVNLLTEAEATLESAVVALESGDVGAHWENEAIEAAQFIHKSDLCIFNRLRARLKKANKDSQITDWTKAVKKLSHDGEETSSHADELVALVRDKAELFHNEKGDGYATFYQNEHTETWALGSCGFLEWLEYRAFKELGFTPTETSTKAAISTLKGYAKHEGEQREVYLRCAAHDDGYLIDMTNDQWQAVEVLPSGWRVIDNPPVRFIRSSTASALPSPTSGNIDLLWRHINISKPNRTLVLAFLLESWRPELPFTILEISGEQGSAKSSTHERLRQLSDPNSIPLRTAPKDVQDVFVAASNNWQASFENMSTLPPKMQDALCTLATGGGFAARKLYSDADESVIEVKRPVIINCIVAIATRPDLIDRTIHLDLPRIDTYKGRKELDEAFSQDSPSIFAGLLDIFVSVLRELPKVHIEKPPRMADFARLGEAVHRVLGIESSFTAIYRDNRAESLSRSLESSPAALAIQELIRDRSRWTGTVKRLKELLEERYHQDGEGWPRSPHGLGKILRRMAPALRAMNIDVSFDPVRHRDGWHVDICSIPIISESGNKVHKVHKFTDDTEKGAKNGANDSDRELVNFVNIDSETKKTSNGDIPDGYSSQAEVTI